MAVVPMCYKICYKDQSSSVPGEISKKKENFMQVAVDQGVSGLCSPLSGLKIERGHLLNNATDSNRREGLYISRKILNCIPFGFKGEASALSRMPNRIQTVSVNASKREVLPRVSFSVEVQSREKQLKSLDLYFEKLENSGNQPHSTSLNNNIGASNRREQLEIREGGSDDLIKAKKELISLDDYLAKVNKDVKSKNYVSSVSDNELTKDARDSVKGGPRIQVEKQIYEIESNINGIRGAPESSSDETSALYLISIIASINIAVFLFEIASPIKNSDLGLLSLPSLYGAKINHLILVGEWWRLVTPMFLHSGVLHVGLSFWVLLTFGPQVCRAYGPFTFLLIYILGGLSGNLTSFLHTPFPTVGGTGPAFAVIGAWLIYQYQNRDVMGKDAFESMFQKAIVATAFGFILSTFGPIDDWTHFGAAFTGIAYGFLTCPALQMDDASSEKSQEEGITLVRRYVDPCKSLAFFSLFILILSSLLFIIEPPLGSIAADIVA